MTDQVNDTEFIRELQQVCLRDAEEHFTNIREALLDFEKDPAGAIRTIMKVLHSLKGNLQAVYFLHFAEAFHQSETTLTVVEDRIKGIRTTQVKIANVKELEVLISELLTSMVNYAKKLVNNQYTDQPEFRNEFERPISALLSWAPKLDEEEKKLQTTSSSISEPNPLLRFPTIKSQKSTPVDSSENKTETHTQELYLHFQNGNAHFAVPIKYVVEVVETKQTSAPPLVRSNIIGLINLRGEVLPLLKISNNHMNSSSQALERNLVVITQVKGHRFGFCVERVHRVLSLKTEDFRQVEIEPDFSISHANSKASKENSRSYFCQVEDMTIAIVDLNLGVAA